jgi:hypothetical protein
MMPKQASFKKTVSSNAPTPKKLYRRYDEIPVIGALKKREIASALSAMGDAKTAEALLRPAPRGKKGLFGWGGGPKPWQHTSHQYGFTPLLPAGTVAPQPIKPAALIIPDTQNLKGKRINVKLDRLRVFDYPGGGEHNILFTFQARNQIPNAPEPVSFSQVYRVQQGETAAVAGQPIFTGLNVGSGGVGFVVSTMNVYNTTDRAFLSILNSEPFKQGLNLLNTVQPVIKPFTDITMGIATMFGQRNENKKVQDIPLGLDFTPAPMGVRLAQGEYIAVQVPKENEINWDEWQLDLSTGAIVRKADTTATLPFNYVIFRVELYEE